MHMFQSSKQQTSFQKISSTVILSIKKQLDFIFYVFSLGNTVKQILGKCDLVASLAASIVTALLALVYKHLFCSMQTSLSFLATQS